MLSLIDQSGGTGYSARSSLPMLLRERAALFVMAVLLFLFCVVLAFRLAAHPSVPVIAVWIIPIGLGLFWFLAWRHENSLSGDSQPGLVALVGTISVGAALLAMVGGFFIRYIWLPKRRT